MVNGLELPFGIKPVVNTPVDAFRYNSSDTPFASIAEAKSEIPQALRYKGMTIYVNDGSGGVDEYWWKSGLTDNDLELKSSGYIDLGDVSYIGFGTSSTYSVQLGQITWNLDEETLDIGIGNGSVLQVGQETLYNVRNNSGATISNGMAVMATGTIGNSGRITVAAMNNDGSLEPDVYMGIATNEIIDGGDGKVAHFGKVRNVDTTGTPYSETWNDGDFVYLNTTVLGGLTNVRPSAPSAHQPVAIVIKAHSNGTLFSRVPSNTGIHDLHDVKLTNATQSDYLKLDLNSGYWINSELTISDDKSPTLGGTLSTNNQAITFPSQTINDVSNTIGATGSSASLVTEYGSKEYTDTKTNQLNQEFLYATASNSLTIDYQNLNYTSNHYIDDISSSTFSIGVTNSVNGSQFYIDMTLVANNTNMEVSFVNMGTPLIDQYYNNANNDGLILEGSYVETHYTIIGWYNGVQWRINLIDTFN